jgi:ubiquitin carboxyl-terminal hydrolase 4/11
VAKAYANLLSQIYSDTSSGTFSPTQFKRVIARYAPSFSGYGQQDSQEFLLFLLDGLQEDLNRIKNKPYIEKPDSTDEMVQNPTALKELADKSWEIYKARNDSVISDLFAGMYKSTVICPVCDKVSIIFDPFTNLTLQLPIENNWNKQIFYFPLRGRPIRIDVDIDKNASFLAVKEYIAKRMGSDPTKLIGAEIYKQRFYKMFDNVTTIAEHNIQSADEVGVYEVEDVPTNYDPNKQKKGGTLSLSNIGKEDVPDLDSPGADRVIIPIFHRLTKIGISRRGSFFGPPSYIILTRSDAKAYDEILRKVIGNVANMTTTPILKEDADTTSNMTTPEDSDTVLMNDDDTISSDSHVKVESVEGEDGLVDVSMKDANDSAEPPADSSQSRVPSVLQSGKFIPAELQNLFEMKIYKSDSEAIPLAWSSLDDNKELVSISERLSRRDRRRAKYEAGSGSNSSEEGLPSRIKNDDSDGRSDQQVSGSGSESDLPSAHRIFSNARKSLNRKARQTYSKKGRKSALNGAVTPPPDEEGWLVRPGEAIVLDWSEEAYDALFEGSENAGDDMRGVGTWKHIDTWPDQELAAKRALRQARRKNGVTLDECLDEFGKMETLSENNSWYCPRCKQHRQANKKFELWKVPDILVMHLKRFSSNRNFRDKLELHVDYPIEYLDLADRVISNDEGKSMVYDLVAVDNHYGGLGGGHYTAVARNFYNKEWYDYNGGCCSLSSLPSVKLTHGRFACLSQDRSIRHRHAQRLSAILPPSIGTAFRRAFAFGTHQLDTISRSRIRLCVRLSRAITLGTGGRSARRLLPHWVVEHFPFNRSRSNSPHGRWWSGTASRSVSRSRHEGEDESHRG